MRKPDPRLARLLPAASRPSDPEPDPLEHLRGQTSGSLEQDCAEETSAILEGFKDRKRRENDRFRRATDTEHWVAICFDSRDAKEAFLAAAGGLDLGDKYIDGHQFAKRLGYPTNAD